ncbi:MAG: carbohydrate kinase [Planctomycetia bacterium]|nr:carbohydrate kinase [Planctomycetia bacterium]
MQRERPIVAIGEILWDVFPDGPRFGGAPANFACHAAGLGAQAAIVSAVGDDDLGRGALHELAQRLVNVECVQIQPSRPTGTVQVMLDGAGKASFEFRSDIAWDDLTWGEPLELLARRAAAVCFGTLAQRCTASRATIQRFVRQTPPGCLRVFDVNLRAPFYDTEVIRESLELANVFKLNDDELPIVAGMFGLRGSERELVAGLGREGGLELVAVTRGPRGALLWSKTGEFSDEPGVPCVVKDTVGAGDSFTAALTIGLLQKRSLHEINRHACRVASYVCSQAGAAPRLPAELQIDREEES